jgi:uncharacterized protein DUF3592
VYGGLFLVLGGVAAIGSMADETEYASVGVTVPAIILGKRTTSGARLSTTIYVVRYRFTTSEGREFQGEGHTSEDHWTALAPGDTVPVQYLAGAPERSRLAEEAGSPVTARLVAVALLLGGAVLTGVGIVQLVALARR